MIKKIVFFFTLIFSVECLFGQPNKHSIITTVGYGALIEREGIVSDFSTFKWSIAYMIQKQHLLFRAGYSNWQGVNQLRHVTQNSLEIGGGYDFLGKVGSIGGMLGASLRAIYGASPQLFNQWSVVLSASIHSQFPITRKIYLIQDTEYVFHSSYNSLSFTAGLKFNL